MVGAMKLTWKKVPSVMTGGKRYFWVAYDDNIENYFPVGSVVWNRYYEKYHLTLNKSR